MKVGDLVRRKYTNWLGLILATNESDMTAALVWVDSCDDNEPFTEVENCSVSLLEVISESR